MTIRLTLILIASYLGMTVCAQSRLDTIINSLDAIVYAEIVVDHDYFNPDNGVNYSYLRQQYEGKEIFNTSGVIAFNDSYVHIQHRDIIKNTDVWAVTKRTKLNYDAFLKSVTTHLNIPLTKSKYRVSQVDGDGHQHTISGLLYAKDAVILTEGWYYWNGELIPAGRVEIASAISPDHWTIIVSLSDNKVLSESNATVYCDASDPYHRHHAHHQPIAVNKNIGATHSHAVENAAYRIFAYPVESPSHGNRTLVKSPWDPIASPFGWHDTDGVIGAESTTTFGNNVRAYKDANNNDEPDPELPEGGVQLRFDFPFHRDSSLLFNLNTDITNLFYWNNLLHDWSHRLGFNEAAGNFQMNNYGRGGLEEDPVEAQTLDGGNTGNANFSAPRDGIRGRMQMYRWLGGSALQVSDGFQIKEHMNTGAANFGPELKEVITERIVVGEDNVGNTFDGCEPLVNTRELDGSIALMDRGTCHFSVKVFNAQEAGAKACIICNNIPDGGLLTMSAGDKASLVKIPSLFLTKEDCDLIRRHITDGRQLTATFNPVTEISSAFDNGIVVHEYGHGISLRLVGGPNNSSCLSNDEQAGEGWSDFIGLVMTKRPNDRREKARGVGTYALGENPDGRGIRRHRYSTSMNVNSQVHSHIRATARPHPLGEVWTMALWELYWDMIDQYGYDATWNNRESGNFKALQIIFDGMKIQGCNVGLMDARDAILSADILNYSGENQCLIWATFAKRGLGSNAIQGNITTRADNKDGFDIPKDCKNAILLSSKFRPIINSTDTFEIAYTIENYKDRPIAPLSVTIELPDDVRIKSVTSNHTHTIRENRIDLTINHLPYGQSTDVQISAITDNAEGGRTFYAENFSQDLNMEIGVNNPSLSNWKISFDEDINSFVANMSGDSFGGESTLSFPFRVNVSSANNLLLFRHRYDTQLGIDGGIVEVSTDDGDSWNSIPSSMFKYNGYDDEITYDILYNKTRPAFTGSKAYNYSIVDLSDFLGRNIMLRFNYVLQTLIESDTTQGWSLSHVALVEKKQKQFKLSVKEEGQLSTLLIDPYWMLGQDISTNTEEVEIASFDNELILSPTPAIDMMTISWVQENSSVIRIVVLNNMGQTILSHNVSAVSGENKLPLNIAEIPAGTYTLHLLDGNHTVTRLFIKI